MHITEISPIGAGECTKLQSYNSAGTSYLLFMLLAYYRIGKQMIKKGTKALDLYEKYYKEWNVAGFCWLCEVTHASQEKEMKG